MHYYKFNIGDYASHTRHLSLLEDLAYRRLIDAYYLSEKPFVGSSADIAKDIGMTSQIEEVHYVLSKFFEKSEDGWINKRCDEEIAKYHDKQEQAVRAGKASAQARLSKRSTTVQPTNNQEPITKKHINTPDGVNADLWNDFLAYRKRLKAPVTDRVIARLVKESKEANMTLEQVLETMIFKGWRSFEAKWIPKDVKQVEKVKFI